MIQDNIDQDDNNQKDDIRESWEAYQLELTAAQAASVIRPSFHPMKKKLIEIKNLCVKYDNHLLKRFYDEKEKNYNAIFLFIRNAIHKTDLVFSSKYNMKRPAFYDPFYFSQLQKVFHELKMIFLEVFFITEWYIRKKFGEKNGLMDKIKKMKLDDKEEKNLQFFRVIRNKNVHNQGRWVSLSLSDKECNNQTIIGFEFSFNEGEMMIDESNPQKILYYLFLTQRLIDILFSWIEKGNYNV